MNFWYYPMTYTASSWETRCIKSCIWIRFCFVLLFKSLLIIFQVSKVISNILDPFNGDQNDSLTIYLTFREGVRGSLISVSRSIYDLADIWSLLINSGWQERVSLLPTIPSVSLFDCYFPHAKKDQGSYLISHGSTEITATLSIIVSLRYIIYHIIFCSSTVSYIWQVHSKQFLTE